MRHLLAVCVLAGSAAGLAAAPVPKAVKKADFFPLAVGHKWEYTGTSFKSAEVTAVADAEDKKHKEYTVKHVRAEGPESVLVFRVTDEGVVLVSSGPAGTKPYLKPATYLNLPLKAGDKWQRVFERDTNAKTTFDFEVGEAEKLTVNGTEYAATRVTSVGGATMRKTFHWYADGVGLVKTETDGQATLELKAFTPGDGKAKK